MYVYIYIYIHIIYIQRCSYLVLFNRDFPTVCPYLKFLKHPTYQNISAISRYHLGNTLSVDARDSRANRITASIEKDMEHHIKPIRVHHLQPGIHLEIFTANRHVQPSSSACLIGSCGWYPPAPPLHPSSHSGAERSAAPKEFSPFLGGWQIDPQRGTKCVVTQFHSGNLQ